MSFSRASKTLLAPALPESRQRARVTPTHVIDTCLQLRKLFSKDPDMSFWAIAPEPPAEKGIPKKSHCSKGLWKLRKFCIFCWFHESEFPKKFFGNCQFTNTTSYQRFDIPVKILNFWVADIKFLFTLVNSFVKTEKIQQQLKYCSVKTS